MLTNSSTDLFTTLGLESASPDEKKQILQNAEVAITERILMRSLEYLPAKLQETLENEKTTTDELLVLLRAYVPNFDRIVTEETDGYMADLVALVSSVDDK